MNAIMIALTDFYISPAHHKPSCAQDRYYLLHLIYNRNMDRQHNSIPVVDLRARQVLKYCRWHFQEKQKGTKE